MVKKAEEPKWYPVRVKYSREMKLKEYLDENQIENFIPLQYKEVIEVIKGEKKVRKLTPVVHNLVFIRSTRSKFDDIKPNVESTSPFRYIMDSNTNTPLVIPEKQMKDFIAVAGAYDEQIVYLDSATVSLKKGDSVRITGGPFMGVEGKLVRIKGDRRVVVSV